MQSERKVWECLTHLSHHHQNRRITRLPSGIENAGGQVYLKVPKSVEAEKRDVWQKDEQSGAKKVEKFHSICAAQSLKHGNLYLEEKLMKKIMEPQNDFSSTYFSKRSMICIFHELIKCYLRIA